MPISMNVDTSSQWYAVLERLSLTISLKIDCVGGRAFVSDIIFLLIFTRITRRCTARCDMQPFAIITDKYHKNEAFSLLIFDDICRISG